MAPVHRRMRSFGFGVALTLLATAAGRASAAEGSASTIDHAAKHGGGDKGDKRCSALSNECGFLTASDLASTEAAAIYLLTTDAEGDVSCDVVDAVDGTATGCVYNEASETFEMAVGCPDGYVVSSTVCAPYVTDGESTVLDVFGTQNVVNVLSSVALCGMVRLYLFVLVVVGFGFRTPRAPKNPSQPTHVQPADNPPTPPPATKKNTARPPPDPARLRVRVPARCPLRAGLWLRRRQHRRRRWRRQGAQEDAHAHGRQVGGPRRQDACRQDRQEELRRSSDRGGRWRGF